MNLTVRFTLLSLAFVVLGTGFGVSTYGSVYFYEDVPDDSVSKCTWTEDVWTDEGCIHHRNFLIGGEKSVASKIYETCVIDSPYVANTTYWCVSRDDGSYIAEFIQPLTKKGDFLYLMIASVPLGLGFLFVIVGCCHFCSDLNQERRHRIKSCQSDQKQGPRKRQRAHKRFNRGTQMVTPRWETGTTPV